MRKWFDETLKMLSKLAETFEGKPDKKWWSHILSWNERYGSGEREWWSGWMIDFLMAGQAEIPKHFQSGVVSTPLKLIDGVFGPYVEDIGELVAGTFGYTVTEGKRAPVVEAKQGWALFLPKGSPVITRMKGLDLYSNNPRDSRDSKDPKDPKDSRIPTDYEDPKIKGFDLYSEDSKDPKISEDVKDPEYPKDLKDRTNFRKDSKEDRKSTKRKRFS